MTSDSQNLTPASNLIPKVVRFGSLSGNGRSLFTEDPSDTGLGNEYDYVSMTLSEVMTLRISGCRSLIICW